MLSETLLKKFDQLISRYPLKRSALVPLLMYAQDEVGCVSEEVIAEVARRVEVRPIEVVEVIGYYSMLHRKPLGKYNVQVCTNISCMLRGADELFEHACKKMGLKHKQVSSDGLFSLEEVECMGACCGAPAIQVNYDFHEYVTPEKFDAVIDGIRKNAPKT